MRGDGRAGSYGFNTHMITSGHACTAFRGPTMTQAEKQS
jgi:hypothetical protein